MTRLLSLVFTLALAVTLAMPSGARAQSLGVDFTSVVVEGNGCCNYTLGFAFTALVNSSVTGLAVFDAAMDGLSSSHQIGLWTTSGALLASTSIASGSAASLMGFWRTVSLGSAVALAAGTQYVVAATNYGFNGALDPFGHNASGFTVDSRISYDQNSWIADAGFVMPTSSLAGVNGYYGANVLLADVVSVPEPGSLLLLATGLVGLVGIRRRRNLISAP